MIFVIIYFTMLLFIIGVFAWVCIEAFIESNKCEEILNDIDRDIESIKEYLKRT